MFTMRVWSIFIIFSSLLFAGLSRPEAQADSRETGERTLSPYFLIQSEDPTVDLLPLNRHPRG